MQGGPGNRACWWTVVVFAMAMAWVESAVVYYLRTMVDRIEPYQPDPLPLMGTLGVVELVREAATMIMLVTAGLLAGSTWRTRLGYSTIAFGVWDIFYYVFLRVMCGWPHSLADWDILFLLPLPWWGPVWAPVAIAILLIVWGTLVTRVSLAGLIPGRRPWLLSATGVVLALYVFMADAIRVSDQGMDAVRRVLPTQFLWGLFLAALALMSAPVLCLWLPRSCQPQLPASKAVPFA
jgi:hypothetical protein